MHVGLGALIVSKSDDDNAMESGVGLAVPTSVEPMPVGLARGGRYGIDSAQGGECSLGAEALGFAPCSDEECRRGVGSYTEAIYQGWSLSSG